MVVVGVSRPHSFGFVGFEEPGAGISRHPEVYLDIEETS